MSKTKIVDHLLDFDDYKISTFKRVYYRARRYVGEVKYFFQRVWERIVYGFPLRESWDFVSFHANYCIPRLKALRKDLYSHPHDLSLEEWGEIIDKMIWSFENMENQPRPIYSDDFDHRYLRTELEDGSVSFVSMNKTGTIDFTPVDEHNKRVQEGLDLFAKYYLSLWS